MHPFSVNRLLRLCFFAVLLAACILPRAGQAQTILPCPVGPDPSWTKTESWVWSQICTGQVADLTALDTVQTSLTSAAPWPADRTISAGFIVAVLTNPRYKLTVSTSPIVISGARVTDPVVIGNATLQNKLVVQASRFDASLEIYDSNFSQGLVLLADRFAGPLIVSRSSLEYLTLQGVSGSAVNIVNSAFADNVLFGAVRFPGSFSITNSKIGGDLGFVPATPGAMNYFGKVAIIDTNIDGATSISNSVFNGEFDGALATFGGGLGITDARFSDVTFFYDTDFVKSVDIADTSFDNDLRFDTSKFESELRLSDVKFCLSAKPCELFLADANFGGKVTISQTLVNGDINTDGASASDSVELMDDSDAEHPLAVTMINATISRDLTIGSTTLSHLQLANASIGGTLQFFDAPNRAWSKNAWLGLSGANIGVLSNAAWDWPAQMNLEGMRFDLIGLKRPDLDHGCIDGDWSLWLRGIDYSPEPYQQLAKYLSDSGDPHAATCVLETSQTIALAKMPPLKKIVYWTYGQVAGFGYAPERAFWFAAGFVVIGMLVLRATGQGKKNNMPIGLFFSFSQFIPLVSLDSRFDSVELTGLARWYFYMHKIVGYIIALFIAAALSGLSNKS